MQIVMELFQISDEEESYQKLLQMLPMKMRTQAKGREPATIIPMALSGSEAASEGKSQEKD